MGNLFSSGMLYWYFQWIFFSLLRGISSQIFRINCCYFLHKSYSIGCESVVLGDLVVQAWCMAISVQNLNGFNNASNLENIHVEFGDWLLNASKCPINMACMKALGPKPFTCYMCSIWRIIRTAFLCTKKILLRKLKCICALLSIVLIFWLHSFLLFQKI